MFNLSFVVKPGSPNERAMTCAAAFNPLFDRMRREAGQPMVGVLHNLLAAATATVRSMDPARPVSVQSSLGRNGSISLHVEPAS